MEDKLIKLSRSELYEKVWSEAMWKLAPELGLSDVGLKKMCHRNGIPTPERGYWAKLEAGHKVKQEPLPNNENYRFEEAYTFYPQPERTTASSAPDIYSEELAKVKDIVVKENLASPHPIIVETKKLLFHEKVDDYGMLQTWRPGCLHLRVSPESFIRALRIMDAIIKGCAKMGFQVENEKDKRGTFVSINGEKVHFAIEEKTTRSDHVLAQKEQKEKEQRAWSFHRRWDFHPTGKLWFELKGFSSGAWKDGKKTLEDQLQDIFAGILRAATESRNWHIRMDEDAKKRREEELRRFEELQRREKEKQQLQRLEVLAGCCNRSKSLRELITQVENKVKAMPDSKEIAERFERWKAMVSAYADRLDPLQDIEAILKDISGDLASGFRNY
jgi:hypothetical protein